MNAEKTIQRYGYEVESILGSGSFGAVFKVKKNGEYFAAKVVDSDSTIMKEFKMLQKAEHPNILKAIETKGPRCLITDLAELGSLQSVIRNNGLSEQDMKLIVRDILKALAHLDKKKMVHFDVKPANILLKKTEDRTVAVLADFGCARDVSEIKCLTQAVGTEWYISTEMQQRDFSKVANNDIFSLGISVKEMRVGIHENYSDLNKDFDTCASPELKDFVACTMLKSTKRPYAKKLLQHKWLKKSWSSKLSDFLK